MKLKSVFFYLLLLAFLFYTAINIFYSQNISPLYSKIVNPDQKSVVLFLKKIKSLPQFRSELIKYSQMYQTPLARQVFDQEEKNNQKIALLKQLLTQNPYSRDLLYGLAVLYNQNHNKNKANYYLKKARQVDPTIKTNL